MEFIKRRRKTAIKIGLVGLMLILGAVVVAPALAETLTVFELLVREQPATLIYPSGAQERVIFEVNVEGYDDDQANGKATVKLGPVGEEVTYEVQVEKYRMRPDEGITLLGPGTRMEDQVIQQLAQLEIERLESNDSV